MWQPWSIHHTLLTWLHLICTCSHDWNQHWWDGTFVILLTYLRMGRKSWKGFNKMTSRKVSNSLTLAGRSVQLHEGLLLRKRSLNLGNKISLIFGTRGKISNTNRAFNAEFKYVSSFFPSPTVFFVTAMLSVKEMCIFTYLHTLFTAPKMWGLLISFCAWHLEHPSSSSNNSQKTFLHYSVRGISWIGTWRHTRRNQNWSFCETDESI